MTYEELLPGDMIATPDPLSMDGGSNFELVVGVALTDVRFMHITLMNLTRSYASGRSFVKCVYSRRMSLLTEDTVFREGVKIT